MEHLTLELGSLVIKEKLKRYIEEFQVFSKRRVCECPIGTGTFEDDMEKLDTDKFVVKIDRSIKNITVAKELKLFQNSAKRILSTKWLRLLHFEKGCSILTFRVADKIKVSYEQHQDMRTLKIINYGDQNLEVVIMNQDTISGKQAIYQW